MAPDSGGGTLLLPSGREFIISQPPPLLCPPSLATRWDSCLQVWLQHFIAKAIYFVPTLPPPPPRLFGLDHPRWFLWLPLPPPGPTSHLWHSGFSGFSEYEQ